MNETKCVNHGLKLKPPETLENSPCVIHGWVKIVLARFEGCSELEPIIWCPHEKSWFQFCDHNGVGESEDTYYHRFNFVEVVPVKMHALKGWLPLPTDDT